jgi:hypothetical protein
LLLVTNLKLIDHSLLGVHTLRLFVYQPLRQHATVKLLIDILVLNVPKNGDALRQLGLDFVLGRFGLFQQTITILGHQFGAATRLLFDQPLVDDTGARLVQGAEEERVIVERVGDEFFVLLMDLQHVLDKLDMDLKRDDE